MKFLKALSLTLPLAGLVTTSAQAVLIDAFVDPSAATPQTVTVMGPPPGADFDGSIAPLLPAVTVIGMERDIRVDRTAASSSGTVSADVNSSLPGFLAYASGPSTSGSALITYDGPDADFTANDLDLGDKSLTFDGSTGIKIRAASDLGATLTFGIFSSTGNSTATLVLPAVGGGFPLTMYFLPFTGLSPLAFVGNADFTMVDAITLLIDGTKNPATDVIIDFFASAPPVPEPGTLALLSAGVLGLGWQHRRKRSNKA